MKWNVVALLGGLGNQLFQVAFGHWLEERSGRATWFDVSCHRDLDLDLLELPGLGGRIRERLLKRSRYWPTPDGRLSAPGRLIRSAHGPRRIVRDYTGWGQQVDDGDEPAWWFGYWQRLVYADSLLPELHSSLNERPHRVHQPAIGVHVRRSDMLTTPSAVPATWFAPALRRLRAGLADLSGGADELPVRVWSDDPEWCRSSLDLAEPFELSPNASAVEHLAEMSRCPALVVSRSTFSWWAARLAETRGALVVYPEPWRRGQALDRTIVPATWIPVPTERPRQSTAGVTV